MQEVKVVKTVYIDNKLKKIYQECSGYKNLNEANQMFFDQFFFLLWVNGPISFTNRYIGERLGYAESTIEKKLRKLDSEGLIRRNYEKKYIVEIGGWNTSRIISLDPFIEGYIKKKMKLSYEEQQAKKPIEEKIEIEEQQASEVEEPEEKFVYKQRKI